MDFFFLEFKRQIEWRKKNEIKMFEATQVIQFPSFPINFKIREKFVLLLQQK